MFEPSLYLPIYLIIVYLLVILKCTPSQRILQDDPGNSGLIKASVVGLFFIIFFGLRPTYYEPGLYMADTSGYADFYNSLIGNPAAQYVMMLNEDGTFDYNAEFIFGGIRNFMAMYGFSVGAWFTVVAAIFVIPKIVAARLLFPKKEYLAFLFLITAMGFYSGGTNGIRNADGSSVFLLGLALLCCDKPRKVLAIIFCVASYYFHHSEIILIASLLLSLFVVKKTNIAIVIWFMAIVTTLIVGDSLAKTIGPWFEDKRVDVYILGDSTEGFRTGFRWDFILYSAVPILMGWYTTVHRGIKDKPYQIILNTYILANAIWIIFMYASFTNRFAALSWSLYPIVLCYPLLKYNIFGASTPQKTALILFAQLLFITIF